jgi:hypothetical protein
MSYNPNKIDTELLIKQINDDINHCKIYNDVFIITLKNTNDIVKVFDSFNDVVKFLFNNFEIYKQYELLNVFNFFFDFKKSTNKYKTYSKFTVYKYLKCAELGNKTVKNILNDFEEQIIFKMFFRKKKIETIWKTYESQEKKPLENIIDS